MVVIPAEAGIQILFLSWIPVFTGMTVKWNKGFEAKNFLNADWRRYTPIKLFKIINKFLYIELLNRFLM